MPVSVTARPLLINSDQSFQISAEINVANLVDGDVVYNADSVLTGTRSVRLASLMALICTTRGQEVKVLEFLRHIKEEHRGFTLLGINGWHGLKQRFHYIAQALELNNHNRTLYCCGEVKDARRIVVPRIYVKTNSGAPSWDFERGDKPLGTSNAFLAYRH